MKKIIVILVFAFGINAYAQKAILTNFRIENSHKDRVYFDTSGDISGLTTQGFVISGKTISSINTSGQYFTVSSPFTFWDNNTIRLENGNGIINNFTLSYIVNNIPEPSADTDRYVTATASGTGDGLTEGTAWTFKQGLLNATAGQTVWIKAGVYNMVAGQANMVGNSGTISSPIKFMGYKTTPGDISSNYYTFTPGQTLPAFDSTEMPLIDGNSFSDAYPIVAYTNNYLIFKNLQIRDAKHNILVRGNTNGTVGAALGYVIENCNFIGGLDANILIVAVKESGNNRYHDTKFRIKNVNSINAEMENISMMGTGNLIENVKTYCDTNGSHNGSDYYISFNGADNIVRNSFAERLDNTIIHPGHGIGIHGGEYNYSNFGILNNYNLIENCESNSTTESFYFRNTYTEYNVIKNCVSTGLLDITSSRWQSGGIALMSGAKNNIIENSTFNKQNVAIEWICNLEGGQNTNITTSGNTIKNCIFNETDYLFMPTTGLLMGSYDAIFTDNIIENCTFKDVKYGIRSVDNDPDIQLSGNGFINCIFDSFLGENDNSVTPQFKDVFDTFENNNYWNSWTTNLGTNSRNDNPNFENQSIGDFRLKKDSPLIDKGKDIDELKSDFDGNSRPQGISTDIGAFEYQENTTSSIDANAGDDQIICQGESITLTASGGSTYSWSNGSTMASITVNPNTTITYTVTVSEGGVSDSDSVQVTVNSVTADAGSNVTINAGESTTLTANGGSSYSWNTGATTQNITVNPNATTTYSVTVTNNGCEDVDEVTVTVNSTTGPINANAGEDVSICSGESTTLTASGGSSYSWSNGATTSSITVSPNATTTYTVTVSEEGRSSDTDSVIVTVDALPVANAGLDVTIEEGESVKLTASGGNTYLWSNGATTQSITVSPNSTTTYSVTVTNNGCEDIDEVEVTVESKVTNPPPADANAGDDISICLGESITLTANGGETYLWSTGATTKSIQVNPTRTTTYTLSATRGGVTNSDTVTVTVENCSALSEKTKKDEFIVYPNPTDGTINIKANNDYDSLNLNIYTINGSIVYSDKVQTNNNIAYKTVDLSNLTKGVYIVRLYNSDYHKTKKILLH